METWSSRPADEGMESTEAGWQRILFSDTSAALVTWTIMKPELSPWRRARNGGSPESDGFTSCSTRRSEMVASWEAAMARTSSAKDTGWPWKLPPETMSPTSANTRGLSVAAFTSRESTARQ